MPPSWIKHILPLIAISLLTLLSDLHQATSAKLYCSNITTSCNCMQTYKNLFDVQCGDSLNIQYDPDKVLDMNCNCFNITIQGYYDEPPKAVACDPISYLSEVNVHPAKTLQVRYCDASAAIRPIEDVIRQAKPSSISFKSMAFPNDVLQLQNQSDPEMQQILKNVTRFLLLDNQLLKVPQEMLNDMSSLDELSLYGNNIEHVTGPFSPTLIFLEMADNNITQISSTAFKGLSKLRSLLLYVNRISSLDAHIFDDLGELWSLELMTNMLSEIDGGIFLRLSKLELLNLSKNQLTQLDENVFRGNTNLTSIRLAQNRLETLPVLIFRMNKKLEQIDLEYNNITYLPSGVFDGLSQLKSIKLTNNRLVNIEQGLFGSLGLLEELKLGGNQIATIDAFAFTEMSNLKTLDLSMNQLTWLNWTTFAYLNGLTILDLSKNQISIPNGDDDSFVNNLTNLVELILSHNRLDYIPVDFVINKHNLRVLEMQANLLPYFDFSTINNAISNVSISLEDNNITQIYGMSTVEDLAKDDHGPHLIKHLNLAGNPLRCDAANYDLFRYFNLEVDTNFRSIYEISPKGINCSSPEFRVGQPFYEESAPHNPCTFPYSIDLCPSACECYHVPNQNKVIVNCAARNLESVPELFVPHDEKYYEMRSYCRVPKGPTVVEVILKENRIKYLQPLSFVNINVTVLDVSFNNLSAVTWIPHGLKTLKLDHNDLRRINKTLLEELTNVTLNNNPWICDCETVPFWIFLGDHERIPNKMEVRCEDSKKSIRKLSRDYLCPTYGKLIITLVIVVAVLILIPAVVLIFFYKYKQEIKVWLFAHNMCLRFVREEDLDKDKIYDAFISFSQKDEEFVAEHLMTKLEQIPDPYKLCVHMRNWIPGEFIAKQVADSVLNSRRTIVVLSPSFLESVWGKMEFRAAHTKAISEGIARVIIILYDDLDPNDERIDEELRVYLKTNTYIRWGDKWFWEKLTYALPHRKRPNNAAYVNRHLESVSVKLDKMDKINQNLPPRVINAVNGSANPPIDPLLLKVHNTPPAEKGIV